MRITDVVPAARGKQRDLVLLNIERLCLMGEALIRLDRPQKAIQAWEVALEEAVSAKVNAYVERCRARLDALKRSARP
jgi:hypothetical protein